MVIISHLFAEWQSIRLPDAAPSGIARPVGGPVIHRDVVVKGPEVLHDVELAARGPADGADVLAQHPESRPDALAKRELDPRNNPPILPTEIRRMRRGLRASRLQPRRRVIPRAVANRTDHQIAFAVLEDILG